MVYKTFQTKLPVLPGLGVVGQTIFNYGFMVYAAIILAVILHRILNHTRIGLNLRAVGETPRLRMPPVSASRSTNIWPPASARVSPASAAFIMCWITIRAFGQPQRRSKHSAGWPLRWSSSRHGSRSTPSGVLTCSVCSIGSINFLPTLLHISVPGYVTDLIQMVPYLVTIVVLVVTCCARSAKTSLRQA